MTTARRRDWRRRAHSTPTCGVVLVCVLVCLSIAATLVATATVAALKQRQRLRSERQLRQVELLLDAGRRRAIAKLASTDAYRGEMWRLDAGSLPGFAPAAIRIEVARQVDGAEPTVTVVATLPAEAKTPVRRTHVFRHASKKPGSTFPESKSNSSEVKP